MSSSKRPVNFRPLRTVRPGEASFDKDRPMEIEVNAKTQ